MTTISFDTLAHSKKLISTGFTQLQAEVQVEAMREIIDERLATKQDLKETENNLQHEMKQMELRIVIRFGAMLAASIAITVSLIKFIH